MRNQIIRSQRALFRYRNVSAVEAFKMSLKSAIKELSKHLERSEDSFLFKFKGLLPPQAVQGIRFDKEKSSEEIIEKAISSNLLNLVSRKRINWKSLFQ